MKPLSYQHPHLKVAKTKLMGRGVFASAPIAAATLIEIAPVIVMSAADRLQLDKTLLHDYIFEWGHDRKKCGMALGMVPLYNHAYDANCDYEMDFYRQTITVKTLRAVGKGEELKFNYNDEQNKNAPVWFTAK